MKNVLNKLTSRCFDRLEPVFLEFNWFLWRISETNPALTNFGEKFSKKWSQNFVSYAKCVILCNYYRDFNAISFSFFKKRQRRWYEKLRFDVLFVLWVRRMNFLIYRPKMYHIPNINDAKNHVKSSES